MAMNDLQARLHALLSERSTWRLARVAPATFLAAGCGAALGALLVAPAFATGAAGVIIGGIAVNITSTWLERLVMLPAEAKNEREALIEDGLAAGDAATRAIVAATLAAAGPDVAAALPADGRAELVDGLERAMRDAGGPLAALAPAYSAALRAPETADWPAIRAATQEQIRISAHVEAGEGAVIERSGIAIADVAGSVDASVKAGKDAEIRDSGIRIEGVAPVPAPASSPPAPSRTIQLGPTAGAGAQIGDSPSSYIEHADSVLLQIADPAERQRAKDLFAYMRRTLKDCNVLPLGKIDQTDATYARPMELSQVYIALNTTDMVKDEQDEGRVRRPDQQRPLSAVEALGRAKDGRMILLGAPGSGKSTFASHLTYCLTGAALAERSGATPADSLANLAGWQHGALVPVPIVLRDLAAFPAVAASRMGSVRLITDFLRAWLAELGCPQASELLLDALREGKALLLLDGLDEVVGDAVLPRVAEAIIDAEKNFPGPILVTCRVLDYQEERLRKLPGFAAHTLAELDPQQIDAFIAAWYAELAASGRRTTAQSGDDAREMQGAVQSRDELRALAGTPLLLTLMAQVHAFRGTLPDARALLYYSCIDLLLLRWRQPRDEPDLIKQLGLARFLSSDLLDLMAQVGYETHLRAERGQASSGSADLDEATLIAILAEFFETYDPVRKHELAGKVLRALARGNGLLLQRGPKVYTFAHRTFQEFLAGYHMKGVRNAETLCLDRARQIHWHEALLLMTGYQVLGQNERAQPINLAEKLLNRGPLEQALAGDILALVGRERAQQIDASLTAKDGLWPKAARALRAVQRDGRPPDVPASLRQRAGLALGRLCYGELKDLAVPGARPPLPDPRLPLAVAASPRSENWRQALAYYWCPIAPGPFWSGDDWEGADDPDNPVLRAAASVGKVVGEALGTRQGQLSRTEIRQPYRIARHPITNADYARFLAANGPNGYDPDKPWWTDEGRAFLRSEDFGKPTRPPLWSTARYNGAMQPVVGVSWYEVAAYCRWLSDEGHAAGWLPASDVIRLPTWHEWERAARHTDTRRYPWGDEPPNPERANYGETQLNSGATIGCFPTGVAVCGAQDMVGNVWEWTVSPWERWDEWKKDFTLRERVASSYSGWGSDSEQIFCGARDWSYPGDWDDNRSFRVVQSRALT